MDFFKETLEVVRRSGDIILEGMSRPRRPMYKGRIDLVTETDLAVEAFLKEKLSALAPGVAFMAEESADSVQAPDGDCWIIDPVDGTTNFVHGLPFVATSVALWRRGGADLGIVNIPALGECFYAQRGRGAFLNGAPIHVSAEDDCARALLATGFPYAIQDNIDIVIKSLRAALLRCRGVRRCGAAAIDLAYVAAGRFDAFYERWLKPWDYAAGWLLVEEAGGRVSGLDGAALDFGADVLATNGRLHESVMHMLALGNS